ncbi:response regulator receiver protein [Sulfuricurvum kujiense DSM 16994]|uniref:Response regulator receiver protein n=1 Tax=Sulfuricurvum kujiense (strain ATCC BAA-921 / DSM 16994 / JCM 11577 / YK-1) TaxID=709032 RepID=E4TWG4_SULKY|nr:response regulator [Sulfuricurvum kujiense]ADR33782.1 response regulator receiver protein [Sulfuricurvum kujiense DSM 16994]
MIRLLIVDDEQSIGTMLEKALGRSGDFKITYIDNPVNALSRFRAGEYDGVLLDIMMPQKDGLSVLEEIKTKDPECVVVMMTAYSTLDKVLQSHKVGADHYLLKPFDSLANVEKKIRELVKVRS